LKIRGIEMTDPIPVVPVVTTDTYPVRIGVAIDETLNVIFFDGQPEQTISEHAAIAQREGKKWGCIMCKILSFIVEQNHCAKQFTDKPTPALAAFRAMLAMSVLVLPLFGLYQLAVWVCHLLF
jgi:hypothetical protein